MTKKDIVEKYIAGYGYKRISGQTLEPIMPVLVLDLMYQIHNEWLAPAAKGFVRKNRYHHQKWMEAYKAFNRRFYAAFTVDEYDEACLLMDDFESVMSNDLTIARIAVMGCFPELETDQRVVLGTISVCNTLCHIANAFWHNVFRKPYRDVTGRVITGDPLPNADIESMIHHSIRLMNEYYRSIGGKRAQAPASQSVEDTVNVMIRHIWEWLKEN
ncbi:MAG: hypothetical protein IJP49_06280 [Bacteroidales bacterium]|nr:hypothetical protein [Bacteroidales bacterium]